MSTKDKELLEEIRTVSESKFYRNRLAKKYKTFAMNEMIEENNRYLLFVADKITDVLNNTYSKADTSKIKDLYYLMCYLIKQIRQTSIQVSATLQRTMRARRVKVKMSNVIVGFASRNWLDGFRYRKSLMPVIAFRTDGIYIRR